MSKIRVTAQQRANALECLNVMWPSVPPENVMPGLDDWREEYGAAPVSCGTVACFGGWCAIWPGFRAQGIEPDPWSGAPQRKERGGCPSGVSEYLFGHSDLFSPRHACIFDKIEEGTDHEVVTKRLRALIKNSVVV